VGPVDVTRAHPNFACSSHPSSPNFGKHWTAAEVHSKFAPSADAVEAVRAWLVESGIEDDQIVHSDNKGWLALDIPASEAERLFNAEFYEHEHDMSESVRIGCDR
jgi:tripeptidyl-peptidase-1